MLAAYNDVQLLLKTVPTHEFRISSLCLGTLLCNSRDIQEAVKMMDLESQRVFSFFEIISSQNWDLFKRSG